MSWMLCQNGSSLAPWKRYFNFLVSYLPGKGISIFWYFICLVPWKMYFNFLVLNLSGSLEKVFLSQKVIQGEYLPGGPVGYGASS